jgi:alpha-tubulin suppressor-like RCC1 family protein
MRALWLSILVPACSLNVDYTGTYYQCNPDGTCPPNFECLDMVCVPSDPTPPACSSDMAAGAFHTCSVRDDHTVWCWGRNDYGQLGDGTATDSDEPVEVAMLRGATRVGAGEASTCALDDKGQVWCWGRNEAGQLGDGTTSDSRAPVQVRDITGATQLSVGAEHACVVKSDGGVACWGDNGAGQLGDGSMTNRTAPTTIMVGPVRAVAAGADSTCAVLMDGSAQCWGENNDGELGAGNTMAQNRPTPVVGLANVIGTAVGDDFACFVTTEGFVHCAGLGTDGQLGTGMLTSSTRPVPALVPLKAKAIAAGAFHTCARDELDQTWCWGIGSDGRLLDGGSTRRATPVRGLVSGVVALSAGAEHTCVLDTEGAIRCAGFNRRGQLGDGRPVTRGAPVPVQGVTNAVALVAGMRHTCAAQQDGQVMCWGENNNGEAGNGSFMAEQTVPHVVHGIASPTQLVAGQEHTCALLDDGTSYCWGLGADGRLGDGTMASSSQPRSVLNLGGTPSRLAGGDFSSFAIVNGNARGWGAGFGTFPTNVSSGVDDIAAGNLHVCTLETDATVSCYGENYRNQLGDGTTTPRSAPGVAAMGVTNAVEVRIRGESSCARIADGTIKCWGLNADGRLGVGNTTFAIASPTPVMGMSGVTKFAMGYDASCAIKTDGTLWCWGANYLGQVGDGSYQTRPAAVQILGLSGVKDVASGGSHTCAIDNTGSVVCWGLAASGQLGTGIRQIVRPVGVRMTCE